MARFRTRARAVDMLGRQQIAGIPTAISELFKNAHDAYAREAIVDYFASDGLFILRDDGVGMTQADFETRWLTLGTESKVTGAGTPAEPPDGMDIRPVLGEKGIGRLAIAAIGPQVIIVTRAVRRGHLQPPVIAVVNWGMFELPGIDLDEIVIPVREVASEASLDARLVAELSAELDTNLDELGKRAASDIAKRIRSELATLEDLDPHELLEDLDGPTPMTGSGTCFFIRPSSPLIARDLNTPDERETPDLLRTLVGFADTMTTEAKPALATSLRHHWTDEAYEEALGPDDFFTPLELQQADQHIIGAFDRFGQFDGTVSIYGGRAEPYQVAWQARGAPTRCGSFELNLAYVQGNRQQSKLDPEAHTAILHKLDRFGGLYIYRDGIRVLPYGNSDFDWLDVERRRTSKASDYFFSYRRMFGAVLISRDDNHDLREKAGREGFAANEAYRQFRDILKNFLYRVAFDYFRTAGARSERFFAERAELERLDKARARRAKQVGTVRRRLTEELDAFSARLDDDQPRRQAAEIVTRLQGRLGQAARADDPALGAELIVDAEAHARRDLAALDDGLDVRRPRGVGLTRELTRAWQRYEVDRGRLAEDVVRPTAEKVEQLVGEAAARQEVAVDRRLRFDAALQAVVERSRRTTRQERNSLRSTTDEAASEARQLTDRAVRVVDDAIAQAELRAATLDVAALSDREFVERRTELERLVRSVTDEQARALQSVTAQLAAITWPKNGVGDYATAEDEVEALEADLERLRAEAEDDVELRQMGLAVEVINHEFQGMVRQIRRDLARLGEWASENPALIDAYRNLRSSFEHLDAYLRLFTPLHRRLQRGKVRITGQALHKYLRELFGKRLNDQRIQLQPSKEFLQASIEQYPSTIYPVFVNLIDNAIYWLTDYAGRREIRLDVSADGFVIEDSGPGVPVEYRDAIFEQGFSEKPGGTGLGLYIAQQVLRREGMDLRLAEPGADAGARFIITTTN
jgi:signal transduction histidine kinase